MVTQGNCSQITNTIFYTGNFSLLCVKARTTFGIDIVQAEQYLGENKLFVYMQFKPW